ncbi:MAG: DUF3489 domain-containing protein [Roseovarius sp.]|nr:DUF3489 domain-containing protein [Roseovarius sp.]
MTQAKPKTARNKTTGAVLERPASGARKDTPRKTRAALMRDLLARPDGASLEDLCTATGWQAHTVRAALSRLRKAGHEVARYMDGAGLSVYRICAPAEAGQ